MKLVLTAAEASEQDRVFIEDIGFDSRILMENAGRSVAQFIESLEGEEKNVAIVCGKGNNGGDGFVTARHLRDMGWNVTVIFIGEPEDFTEDSQYFFDIISELQDGILIFQYLNIDQLTDIISTQDVLVDAILGTGSKGELQQPYDEIIMAMNGTFATRVAIDIPTGLNPDTGTGGIIFNALYTVALGSYKRGYYYGKGIDNRGLIEYGYIGAKNSTLETEAGWKLYELNDVSSILLSRRRSVNKYTAGGPVMVAGSNRYPGSAAIVYQAAFTSGSGSPILFTSEKGAAVTLNRIPEAVIHEFSVNFNSEILKSLMDELEKKDVLLIGPGLGRSPETTIALDKILSIENKMVILDADALTPLYNGNYKKYNLNGKILLPHTGEFAKLLGKPLEIIEKDIFQAATDFAQETGCILVLKHAAIFVCHNSGINYILDSGHDCMAKFGTGDGLAGVIASVLAQILVLPQLEVESILDLLKEGHNPTVEFFISRICDAIHTYNISALILVKEQTGLVVSASTIIQNLPVAIKKIDGE
ncbi:MAG: NAD(P)H-hydrate epimerase [Ignavibacteriales bacterium]|nr:NAD(P)H-hydrate epimerase [Ignavibacteriales bacterium]